MHAGRAAAARAVGFLARAQSPGGALVDYDGFPIGLAVGWTTGYVGLALAEAAAAGVAADVARAAAERAASWLVRTRTYSVGWGWNGFSGADADSTAWALLLLRAVGRAPERRDLAFLVEHRRDGGFATYRRGDGWGDAHPDVTPVAFLALPENLRASFREPTLEFVRAGRLPDGAWPAYWWRGCHYATWWNLRLLRALGDDAPAPPPLLDGALDGIRAITSPFDVACALGWARLADGGERVADRLLVRLLDEQLADGRWAGAPNLRVTDPACHRPWERPEGALYEDTRSLLTTATALRALVEAVDPASVRARFR